MNSEDSIIPIPKGIARIFRSIDPFFIQWYNDSI